MDAPSGIATTASLPAGYYNAALDLLDRNVAEGRGDKLAVIDDRGRYTYGELTARANRFANALAELGVRRGERVLLALLDSVDFPTAFLGAIKAGIVPVCVNTLLTPKDFDFMLEDTGATALVVSQAILGQFTPILERHRPANGGMLQHIVVSGETDEGALSFEALIASAPARHKPALTVADDICFWLYSSGSTGTPKGAVHIHSSLMRTAELYARPILGITEDDVTFSAAKLFFAYGLGNNLTFPFAVGATAVLMAERPTPAACFKRLVEHQPTLFFGVPTLYGAMLSSPDMPTPGDLALRHCVSAGEALPADLARRWKDHFGVDILDGIGSTEMLHIFISNRPGDIAPGTSGRPVPGYEARLVGEDGQPVQRGEMGELWVSGPSACIMYWRKREKSLDTFHGRWTRTGDKYLETEDGHLAYCGRADDMMKVSGQYVSPFEVEGALVSHQAVLEAAVVAHEDADGLIKPRAFIVLREGVAGSDALAQELKDHVKAQIAPYKYPRWFDFVDELPKTATGKIQRFKLRQLDK
ncbi:MAG: benzoate-CoA ligase family protein [Azospirillaceae bacterium]